jgi:low temperature requirement protein LtrA
VSDAEHELAHDPEHQVTPLELFFDLTFVFAMTQVTVLLADDPTWGGVLRGMLVLAALWWGWGVYAWLTSAMDIDEGGVRLAMLAAMGAMFGVALAVPGAFGDDAVLFGVAYFLVRLLHLVLSAIVVRDDTARRGALLRFAPTAMLGASLIVFAGFLEGPVRITVWLVALAIDYLGPAVVGVGRGWRVAPEHFAERYGLIVLIALGESIIAIGLGAGLELDTGVIVAAALGIVVVSSLWWLYFDVAAIFARRRLMEATGLELHRLALHAYSYLHLPIVAASCSSLSASRRLSVTSASRSTPSQLSPCAVVPRCTCSHTSRSSSALPAASSGAERSVHSRSSPSSRPQLRFRRSQRSPSSAACAPSSSRGK